MIEAKIVRCEDGTYEVQLGGEKKGIFSSWGDAWNFAMDHGYDVET